MKTTGPYNPPLTARARASYDQFIPIPRTCMANRSDAQVSRVVPAHSCRGWVFVSAAALCLLGGAKTGRASGCHVAERPMLGSKLTADQQLLIDLSAPPPVYAPLVLTHLPCQGEVPGVPDIAGSITSALVSRRVGCEPPGPAESLPTCITSEHAQPPGFRLDRPPRPVASCGTIELPA
jgi:hypothetical protein